MTEAKTVAERYAWEIVAMIPAAVTQTARQVSALLNGHRIPHAIAGGMAVSLHGYHRATSDVDILVPSSAKEVIETLGQTRPISGHLDGVTVTVGEVEVDFLFLGQGITLSDISSPDRIAGLPVVSIETLVSMKIGAGRHKDEADIIELIKLGKIPVEKVTKHLSGETREDFVHLVTLAELESRGRNKEAKRLHLERKLG